MVTEKNMLRIVPAVKEDVKTIVALRKQIWATTYRGICPDSMIDDFDDVWHWAKELQRIKNPEYRVYRIMMGDCSIGYVSIRKTDILLLQSLYLLKEYQHQGIGRFVFDFLRGYCREQGETSFICNCQSENWNARGFYEKMGGKVIAEDMDNEERFMNSITYQFEV